MQSDASQGELVYKSIANNPYLDQSQGTSYTRLVVRDGMYSQWPSKKLIFVTSYYIRY